MAQTNLSVKFCILLILVLIISFGAHIGILSAKGLPLFDNLIVRSYVVNGIMAALIFIGLYRFREKLRNQIGFLFMGGSLFKFLIFFILFYPSYKADGDMTSLEFAAFFVPYGLGLILETYFTSKMLNNLETPTEN